MKTKGFPPRSRQKLRPFNIEINHRLPDDSEIFLQEVRLRVPRLGNSQSEIEHANRWLCCHLLGGQEAYAYYEEAQALEGEIFYKQLGTEGVRRMHRHGLSHAKLTPNQAFLFDGNWTILWRIELQEIEGEGVKHAPIRDIAGKMRQVYFQRLTKRIPPPKRRANRTLHF